MIWIFKFFRQLSNHKFGHDLKREDSSLGLWAGTDANFPIDVGFEGYAEHGKWAIFNQNGPTSSIPIGASFYVYMFSNHKVYLPMIIR
ncbi:MAG: hypothetical protein BGO78_07450 [Chloroflexi bacterium 44-23]|nr:MAG: hypothetical protein BGO78_07450 [Chloroflexi bacterium 44-23]